MDIFSKMFVMYNGNFNKDFIYPKVSGKSDGQYTTIDSNDLLTIHYKYNSSSYTDYTQSNVLYSAITPTPSVYYMEIVPIIYKDFTFKIWIYGYYRSPNKFTLVDSGVSDVCWFFTIRATDYGAYSYVYFITKSGDLYYKAFRYASDNFTYGDNTLLDSNVVSVLAASANCVSYVKKDGTNVSSVKGTQMTYTP